MFGRQQPTAQRVACRLGLIETVRKANSRYQNPYSTTIYEPEKKIVLSNREDQINYFLHKKNIKVIINIQL